MWFVCFKQKTAYEMRISDWSSDVCASDLGSWDPVDEEGRPLTPLPTPESKRPALASVYAINKYVQERMTLTLTAAYGMGGVALQIGSASCRERVCPYV